jgi:hypothetical protein
MLHPPTVLTERVFDEEHPLSARALVNRHADQISER